uniref:Uncharacterized protein n=1 Tax=Chrysotila carterae TaxID=13221 RepID=A0A7S4C6I6_CHRCT|mmetsp:Transcript_57404/g.124748  ORF Transcript_57404/g.124748 Transcript_57404/m.124748 type:complete len:315 (+) Transcript_57404:176-1120(+)
MLITRRQERSPGAFILVTSLIAASTLLLHPFSSHISLASFPVLLLGARNDQDLQAGTHVHPFSESARFERWSHFKDVGLRAVISDALGQAAIADGTCRLLRTPFSDFAFWRHPARVRAVLTALAGAPATASPSAFTLYLARALHSPCYAPDTSITAGHLNDTFKADLSESSKDSPFTMSPTQPSVGPAFSTEGTAAALYNWHRALCAPAADPSWHGTFDPAYQPQQQALTAGYMCIATYDVHGRQLSGTAVTAFSSSERAAADAAHAICAQVPWGLVDFRNAENAAALAALTAPLLRTPCGNQGGKEPSAAKSS